MTVLHVIIKVSFFKPFIIYNFNKPHDNILLRKMIINNNFKKIDTFKNNIYKSQIIINIKAIIIF